jgi:ABC-2 type transport system ATP-binding protein
MPIIVSQLTKLYGAQRAVDDLSFEVKPGEILGFLGPNGAGKTTTMKIITCYLTPSAGQVSLDQYNVTEHPMEVRRAIGYLPEHNPLYLDMYVKEFLDFAARIYRLPAKTRTQRIREVIDRTGLGLEQHKKIGMLSKGYRQRVGLAQALIHDPRVLILDEPTTGLDPNQIVEIRALIKEVGKDKTIIFSSHILSEVEAIADRVIIIHRGKLVADKPTAELRAMAGEGLHIRLEVQFVGLDAQALAQLPGVVSVSALSPTLFEVRAAAETEVRPALFELCVNQKNPILGLQAEAFTLEDAFRKLTSDPQPSPARS